MYIFQTPNFDFLRWRWHAFAFSLIVIIAGIVTIATKGIPSGVEFAGGTVVILQFEQPTSDQQVRDALERMPGSQNIIVQSYGDPGQNQTMIRVPTVGEESGESLGDTRQAVETALQQSNVGTYAVLGTEIVGPSVGQELRTKALWATFLSLIGILAYLAFRYQLSFGVGAIVASIHDLLFILAFLAFFQYEMTLNVIAAILTIVGYSTNDTIVIFDRVRENMRSMRRDDLNHVINVSVNQTLIRTAITAGTALFAVLGLLFFGGEVLNGFAFTMAVGIIAGTYSTVFIAAAVVSFWRGAGPKRAAAHAPGATSAPQPPAGAKARQRKARAS